MKLVELSINQSISLQFVIGERVIEFESGVISKDEKAIYAVPYIHNGKVLDINMTQNMKVICNVFADDLITGQRISWRNVEINTVEKNKETVYCIRTYGFNNNSCIDDRRHDGRLAVEVDAWAYEKQIEDGISITLHDISETGIAFCVPKDSVPREQQITISFKDNVDDKMFDIRIECSVVRINIAGDNAIVGCRLVGENKDYQMYRFMKYLKAFYRKAC